MITHFYTYEELKDDYLEVQPEHFYIIINELPLDITEAYIELEEQCYETFN